LVKEKTRDPSLKEHSGDILEPLGFIYDPKREEGSPKK
jgi:hypothetical protein